MTEAEYLESVKDVEDYRQKFNADCTRLLNEFKCRKDIQTIIQRGIMMGLGISKISQELTLDKVLPESKDDVIYALAYKIAALTSSLDSLRQCVDEANKHMGAAQKIFAAGYSCPSAPYIP